MKNMHLILPLVLLSCCSNIQEAKSNQNSCEWCGANEAPKDLEPTTTIAGIDEAGERMKISGTVFQNDGQTPASNVILYMYHTNVEGIYPKRGDEKGNAKRHGYLRGWIKTGKDGQYEFETIKPEPYPGRTIPAHIHITVKEPNREEYWIKDYFFEGDEFLSPKDIKNETNQEKFNHVIKLYEKDGLMVGKRDILLKN